MRGIIVAFSRAVLVHGGMHGSWCWEKVIPHLDGEAIAVDLPGRPGNMMASPTLDGWTDTIIQAASARSLLVAHSLAGLIALAAASRAPDRIAGIVFIAALVLPPGHCGWDALPKPLDMIRRVFHIGEPEIIAPRPIARWALCNGLSPNDQDRVLSRLVPEPSSVLGTPVDYRLADGLDLTYVHTSRDRTIPVSRQRRYAAYLPTGTARPQLDCGHSAMYAYPEKIAAIINQRLRS